MLKRWSWLLLFLITIPLMAQEATTYLALRTESTELETGQSYEVRLEMLDTPSFWAVNLELSYDPSMVYIVGTKSGSPVQLNSDMGEQVFRLFNLVNAETSRMNFGVSLLNPAEPKSGSFVIGSFTIVPLRAGTSQISFSQAQVTSITYETDAAGQRTNVSSQDVSFLPVLLELSITGEPVEPPSEATATPTASFTPEPSEAATDIPTATALVNVTLAPSNLGEDNLEAEDSSSSLLFVGIGLVIVAGFGLLGLFVLSRRRK